ncbi:MAG: hypothetical protein ACYCWE_01940 [Eubacteriales bacterium]
MKKTFLPLLFITAVLLTSCSQLVRITYKDGKYIDSAHNIRYENASVSYEPVSEGTEYARYNKTVLYTIPGAEPTEWLAEKYEGIGSVFYSEDAVLPALSEFEAVKILIYVSGFNNLAVASINDAEVIAELTDIIASGEQTEAKNTDDSYSLKIASDKYPFLYYNLVYIISSDGERYVYDRGTKQTVAVGTLLDKYFTGDPAHIEPETDTE